jgi:hypothetical protein
MYQLRGLGSHLFVFHPRDGQNWKCGPLEITEDGTRVLCFGRCLRIGFHRDWISWYSGFLKRGGWLPSVAFAQKRSA